MYGASATDFNSIKVRLEQLEADLLQANLDISIP